MFSFVFLRESGQYLIKEMPLLLMAKSRVPGFNLISFDLAGRALVAFKTREGAERVTKKLADGCLMVSNQRYISIYILDSFWHNNY